MKLFHLLDHKGTSVLLLFGLGLCGYWGYVGWKAHRERIAEDAQASKSCVYANARFGFRLKYPCRFQMVGESDNGDGVTLRAASEHIEIRAWGSHASFAESYQFAKADYDQHPHEFQLTQTAQFYTYTGPLKPGDPEAGYFIERGLKGDACRHFAWRITGAPLSVLWPLMKVGVVLEPYPPSEPYWDRCTAE